MNNIPHQDENINSVPDHPLPDNFQVNNTPTNVVTEEDRNEGNGISSVVFKPTERPVNSKLAKPQSGQKATYLSSAPRVNSEAREKLIKLPEISELSCHSISCHLREPVPTHPEI